MQSDKVNNEMPERCLLAQAAHWYFDQRKPTRDEVYENAPVSIDADPSKLRKFFIFLSEHDCNLKGDLAVKFTTATQSTSLPKFDIPIHPTLDLKEDVNLSLVDFNIAQVYFERSEILVYPDDDIQEKYKEQIQEIWNGLNTTRIDYKKTVYRNVTVDFAPLVHIHDTSNGAAAPLIKGNPGRPPKYPWDVIWAELVVRADLDNLPETQAECVSWIQDWYQGRFDSEAPSEQTLKSKLSPVYRHPRKTKADN